jgi:TonB family protein
MSLVPALHADQPTDLQKHLQDRFLNKIFMIRNFYGGSHLVFDSQGNLLEGDRSVGYEGCWSAAQIEIHKLEINKDRLTLRGPRVFGIYSRQTREISQLRRERQEVELEVQLDPAHMDEDSITATLAKVFVTREDDLGRLIPYVWSAPGSVPPTPEPSFRPGTGAGPKPLHTPDPDYSEEARKAKYQGEVGLWMLVDDKGNVARIKIDQCLGYGLDQQTIRAVSGWKFEPATKEGKPVAIETYVMTSFHLY